MASPQINYLGGETLTFSLWTTSFSLSLNLSPLLVALQGIQSSSPLVYSLPGASGQDWPRVESHLHAMACNGRALERAKVHQGTIAVLCPMLPSTLGAGNVSPEAASAW